jgi:hypothetical protein
MIIHIDAWLDELKRLRAEFEQGCAQHRGLAIERPLYYAALIMRKLSETPFIGRSFLSGQMKGRSYEPPSRSLDKLDWLDVWSRFDFSKGKAARIPHADICHILIHSQFLDWRPASGPVREILAIGRRVGFAAVGFAPLQFSKMLRSVEVHKFKKLPVRTVGRAE